MAGKTSGLVPLAGIERVVNAVVESHCILRYHVLTLQKTTTKKSLNSVLEEAVKLLILLNLDP